MKPAIFALLLFLATNLGSAYPNSYEPQTKGLPPATQTKGLPPPESLTTPLTKGLPPEPQTKGLPPEPQTKGLPPEPQTKGLPPEPQTKGLSSTILSALPEEAVKGISSKCLTTLLGVVTDPEFLKCIPLTAVLPIAPILLDPSVFQNFLKDPAKNYPAIQKPFTQFSDGICAAPKCDDKKVAQAVKAMEDGCQEDIKNKNPFVTAALAIGALYSPLHDSICFKDAKKVYCWDETLTGAISLPKSPVKIVDGGLIDSVAVADPSAICSPCNKAIVNTFGNYIKDNKDAGEVLKGVGLDPDKAWVFVAVKCGMSFEDGKVPDPGKDNAANSLNDPGKGLGP